MNSIISGTSTERIIRSLLFSLLVDFFAVYFLYDGHVGYPHKNMVQLASLMGLSAAEAPAPNPEMTEARGLKLAETIRAGETLEKLTADLGNPPIRQSDAVYYPGPGGWLLVQLDRDRVREARWTKGPHSEADQKIQKWIGWGLIAVGLAATLNLARVIGTRASLTAEGLRVSGRPIIPLASMTALKQVGQNFNVSDLEYAADGATKSLRLDPYMFKQARAIAQEIASQKGWKS